VESTPFRTHYDNLKVARDAPSEVIRAAYKTLSQKYHPDRNGGNAKASRIMQIINASYEVLSDPRRRRAHDEWISQAESDEGADRKSGKSEEPPPSPTQVPSAIWKLIAARVPSTASATFWFRENWGLLVCGILIALYVYVTFVDKAIVAPLPGPKPYSAVAPPVPIPVPDSTIDVPRYIRPSVDPKGYPWPHVAQLLLGYPRLNIAGHSKVTVDNSQSDSDVFIKLVSLSGSKAYPVRTAFIPARGSLTLEKLTAGSYDIRYRDLDDGSLTRTESFDITEHEVRDERGTVVEFTTMSYSLYKVQNGNAQSYPLAESEF
jgi:hypothetical protein